MKLCFVSVNDPRETYFVDAPRIFLAADCCPPDSMEMQILEAAERQPTICTRYPAACMCTSHTSVHLTRTAVVSLKLVLHNTPELSMDFATVN
jgi:hypothetical protein